MCDTVSHMMNETQKAADLYSREARGARKPDHMEVGVSTLGLYSLGLDIGTHGAGHIYLIV